MKYYRRTLIILAFMACISYLVRIALVPHKSNIIERINPSVTVTVPVEWKRQVDIEPPQHTIILANHSTVWANIYKKSDIDLDLSDSRRPQYYAKRYAEAWGTALWKWEGPDNIRIFQTWRKQKELTNLVVSAKSQSAEASIVAFVDNKTPQRDVNTSLSNVRHVIQMLLSSSYDEASNVALFPDITTLLPNSSTRWKRLRETKDSEIIEKIGDYKITIPMSWYPSDLNIPSADFTLNLGSIKSLVLNLDSIPTGEYNGTIQTSWLDRNVGRKAFLKFQQSLVVNRPEAIIRYLPIGQNTITVYTLGLEDTSMTTLYRYNSSELAFKAQAITGTNTTIEEFDNLVYNIVNQLLLNFKQQSKKTIQKQNEG